MNSARWSNISSIFQHGLQDGYLSLNPHVKGGLFPLTEQKLVAKTFKIPRYRDGAFYLSPFTSVLPHLTLQRRNERANTVKLFSLTGSTIPNNVIHKLKMHII